MAKPRVFVSSTYYDLKHIRSSLELFIESLGYEPVLSEKGDIAYTPDGTLDESCYREAAAADIFVLIVGGRYGSEASGGIKKPSQSFFERYDSITRKEFESAYAQDIPVYIVIDSGVHSEYQTYLRNKDNEKIRYAHVDSVNVFKLVEDILAKPRNNPLFTFERSSQIETWLREQWAGFFRELLKTRSQQRQLLALTGQVGELKAVNETLKTYLEAVMKGIGKDASTRLIESEEKRLEETKRLEQLRANDWCTYTIHDLKVPFDAVVEALKTSTTASEIAAKVGSQSERPSAQGSLLGTLQNVPAARADLNSARSILGVGPIVDWGVPVDDEHDATHADKTITKRPRKSSPDSSHAKG